MHLYITLLLTTTPLPHNFMNSHHLASVASQATEKLCQVGIAARRAHGGRQGGGTPSPGSALLPMKTRVNGKVVGEQISSSTINRPLRFGVRGYDLLQSTVLAQSPSDPNN